MVYLFSASHVSKDYNFTLILVSYATIHKSLKKSFIVNINLAIKGFLDLHQQLGNKDGFA